MTSLFRAAGVQMDVKLGDRAHNLARIQEFSRQAFGQGARLVVFPECAISGYCFDSLDEAREHAETVPGPATQQLTALCQAHQGFVVVGLLESDGPRLFNACILVGPSGLIGLYRKIHLPFLGIDRFTTPGDRPFETCLADDLRLGMNICYDGSFPESSRVMALAGADLIVLPTNWPPGAECNADFVINTRALENHVYYMAVNRVGTERGFTFIGRSRICDPRGRILAQAGPNEEQMLLVEIDVALARNKHLVRIPGKHEIHRFADRRPEMYASLVAPKSDVAS